MSWLFLSTRWPPQMNAALHILWFHNKNSRKGEKGTSNFLIFFFVCAKNIHVSLLARNSVVRVMRVQCMGTDMPSTWIAPAMAWTGFYVHLWCLANMYNVYLCTSSHTTSWDLTAGSSHIVQHMCVYIHAYFSLSLSLSLSPACVCMVCALCVYSRLMSRICASVCGIQDTY